MRIGLVQLNSSDDPAQNLPITQQIIANAAQDGAEFVLTPEVTNCVSTNRDHQNNVLRLEADDITLAAIREQARDLGIWILIGSLALKTDDPDGRFANRSFLISPKGEVVLRYDKIHMFDVAVSPTETYEESRGYRGGDTAVIGQLKDINLGLTVCYDLRFPYLYRHLAHAGANVICAPAAMSTVTGPAHIEVLLRARAIENGCYLLMPSQTGSHKQTIGKPRKTWGHSMAIDPWGKVLCDMGTEVGFTCLDLDVSAVKEARAKVPSLKHDRNYKQPKSV